jgi:hypothetical protein
MGQPLIHQPIPEEPTTLGPVGNTPNGSAGTVVGNVGQMLRSTGTGTSPVWTDLVYTYAITSGTVKPDKGFGNV